MPTPSSCHRLSGSGDLPHVISRPILDPPIGGPVAAGLESNSLSIIVELEAGIRIWIDEYNHLRPHQALAPRRPWALYRPEPGLASAA